MFCLHRQIWIFANLSAQEVAIFANKNSPPLSGTPKATLVTLHHSLFQIPITHSHFILLHYHNVRPFNIEN